MRSTVASIPECCLHHIYVIRAWLTASSSSRFACCTCGTFSWLRSNAAALSGQKQYSCPSARLRPWRSVQGPAIRRASELPRGCFRSTDNECSSTAWRTHAAALSRYFSVWRWLAANGGTLQSPFVGILRAQS